MMEKDFVGADLQSLFPAWVLQMFCCENALQPSPGASHNSNLLPGRKLKSIFPLNYSAAYLSNLKGTGDELSCCS